MRFHHIIAKSADFVNTSIPIRLLPSTKRLRQRLLRNPFLLAQSFDMITNIKFHRITSFFQLKPPVFLTISYHKTRNHARYRHETKLNRQLKSIIAPPFMQSNQKISHDSGPRIITPFWHQETPPKRTSRSIQRCLSCFPISFDRYAFAECVQTTEMPILGLLSVAENPHKRTKPEQFPVRALCRHRPIFPGRRQPSIVGTSELNFRVRDGNGWTLSVINTYYVVQGIYPEN